MPDIGRLTAYFDANTAGFDRGVRGVEAKVLGLTGVMKSLGSASVALQGPLGGVAGRLQGISALASQASGSLGILGVGLAVSTVAAAGLGVALFGLAKHSAEAGGELFDLSQKTGMAVETLSGLSIVAETTGSDIKSISNSLFIFQSNMVKAQDASSEMGKTFKSLKIDTQDQEKAVRQAIAALFKMGETEAQAAKAKMIFGKAGKDVLAIIKETNGDLDAAIARYADMGLIISTSAARASDKFNDVLRETELQLTAVTRTIGMELLPVATKTLQDISAWLARNKNDWKAWGETTVSIIGGVVTQIGYIIAGLEKVLTLTPIEISIIERVQRVEAVKQATTTSDLLGIGVRSIVQLATGNNTPDVRPDLSGAVGGAGSVMKPKSPFAPGGGGGKGGGAGHDPAADFRRLAEAEMRATLESLKIEEDGVERSYEKRRIMVNTYFRAITKLEQLHHDTVLAGLDAETAAAQKIHDPLKRKIELREIEIKRIQESNRFRTAENQLDDKILGLTRERISLVQTLIEMQTRLRRVSSDVILADLGGGSVQVDEETRNAGTRSRRAADGKTRERIATVDEQVARDRIAKIREQMQSLAGDLTSIFSSSISAGFNDGIKSGLQTLAQGLLQIVEQVFLKRLAEGLSQMLGNLATGSGGGFWGGLLKAVVGGAIGGAAGGAAGSISLGGGSSFTPGGTGAVRPRLTGRAVGGPVSPMSSYMVGEHGPEMFVPNTAGNIIPNGKTGQTVINNYSIQLPPSPNSSYSPRKSARQHADMVMAYLQGTQ